MFWMFVLAAVAAVSFGILLYYIRRSSREGHRVLVAHGMILLLGFVVLCFGVAAIKLTGFGVQ